MLLYLWSIGRKDESKTSWDNNQRNPVHDSVSLSVKSAAAVVSLYGQSNVLTATSWLNDKLEHILKKMFHHSPQQLLLRNTRVRQRQVSCSAWVGGRGALKRWMRSWECVHSEIWPPVFFKSYFFTCPQVPWGVCARRSTPRSDWGNAITGSSGIVRFYQLLETLSLPEALHGKIVSRWNSSNTTELNVSALNYGLPGGLQRETSSFPSLYCLPCKLRCSVSSDSR